MTLDRMTLWSHALLRSHYKLKPFYLHYHSACGHQTQQDGDLSLGAPSSKVTLPCDYVVLGTHVTNWNHYVSSTTMPMATKHDRMVITLRGSYPQFYLTFWSLGLIKSHDKLKPFYLHCHNAHGQQTWQGGDLHEGLPSIKSSPLPQCLWPLYIAG